MDEQLDVPITIKMRIFDDDERTLKMVQRLREAGAAMITVHGRTRHQTQEKISPVNWKIIKTICDDHPGFPIVANGGIWDYSDIEKCLKETGCVAVMSAERILEYPAFYQQKLVDIDLLTLEYLALCRKYEAPQKFIKEHLLKLLHKALKTHTDLREKLEKGLSLEDFEEICIEMAKRRKDEPIESKFGWYKRHEENKIAQLEASLE